MTVAVVTDSTAYLPPDEASRYGITVVPVTVVVGGREFLDGSQISADTVSAALRVSSAVTTSRPSPERFLDVYEAAAAGGATGVVSVHLSGAMSGTVEAARLAAQSASIPVEVVDSRSVGMGLGFAVVAAGVSSSLGESLSSVASAARRCAGGTFSFFYVDTLEYLRRSGRIGVAAGLLGSALSVKPLLHVSGGSVALLEKVRTASRALSRLEDLAVVAAGDDVVNVGVQHLGAAERAAGLVERLRGRVPKVAAVWVGEIGAAIGVHTGPGVVGVTISPA
ncbi:DegV family protein [Herbidospora galbida]|uniref:DegV family protein n=1 Tax=Herbidospora galbida TaxID=2575442 RepID=A0A4U3MIE3_9ACTN|nr:DegV family protein [Herbidospora galbida]TKK89071.1 DegV family protein [Herbidospora galbida]